MTGFEFRTQPKHACIGVSGQGFIRKSLFFPVFSQHSTAQHSKSTYRDRQIGVKRTNSVIIPTITHRHTQLTTIRPHEETRRLR